MMAKPGRPELSLDAGSGPEARFGAALRQLRENAGSPTYREMAARPGVHFSASVLSTAANGKKLPRWDHVRAYVIACEGEDCAGAIKYWKRQWRRYFVELNADCGESGARSCGEAPVAVNQEKGCRRRLLATAGTVSAAVTAAVVLAAGEASPPPATQLKLGVPCESVGVGNTATPVRVPPGYLDGLHYETGYRFTLRSGGGVQKVACVVDHPMDSESLHPVLGIVKVRVGLPDGSVSAPAITVRIPGGPGTMDDIESFGGRGSGHPTEVVQVFSVPPGSSAERVVVEFETPPGAGEIAVVIADPDFKLLWAVGGW
ncbi:helix-turn-helix domain-containing protein [Amycolatopsis plumensis]|uniref:Helix-turn-helix domain-containing protein n=1 Tax=Amycolatopsis plumensis TaxID=236508 RepID=A0ABV5U6D1_9PSEU